MSVQRSLTDYEPPEPGMVLCVCGEWYYQERRAYHIAECSARKAVRQDVRGGQA